MAIAQRTSSAIQTQRANVNRDLGDGCTETDEDELDDCNDSNPRCFLRELSHRVLYDMQCESRWESTSGLLYTFELGVPEEEQLGVPRGSEMRVAKIACG